MDQIPTASGLQRLDEHINKKLIKDDQQPTVDIDMGGSNSPQQISHSPAKSNSGRASFSSVREVDDDIAQAFSSSKISSYFREGADEAVIDDSGTRFEMAETQFMPPVTQPHSKLHGCWFPAVAADNFHGWKQIDVKGKQASRSYGDLQALRMVWSAPTAPKKKPQEDPVRPAPGSSPFERLPMEIKSELSPLI